MHGITLYQILSAQHPLQLPPQTARRQLNLALDCLPSKGVTMFALHVSHNCGSSYCREREAETLDELHPRMAELDEGLFRWYLTKDGEDFFEEVCAIHKGILQFMEQADQRMQPTEYGG